MDTMDCECPTEILVDIKDECQCSHINRKEFKTFFNSMQSETGVESYSSVASSKYLLKDETILDVSPFRSFEEFNVKENVKSQVNLKQDLDSDISDGCPTAILINVSPPTDFYLKDNHVSTCNQYLNNFKASDLEENLERRPNDANDYKSRGNRNSSDTNGVESQILLKRLRWKTPSPQSMSRINKEACKVIDHLNSSSVFDEDILLTEEILPVTLNFDEFEDEEEYSDEMNAGHIFSKDAILNHKLSKHEQSLKRAEEKDENLSCHSSNCTPENAQDNLKETCIESNIVKESSEISCKNYTNSDEGNAVDIFDKDAIFNHKLSEHEQSLNRAEEKDENLSCHSSNCTPENAQDNLKETCIETNIVKESTEISCKNYTNSKESYSCGIHSSSLENSGSLSNCDEVDDVFNITHMTFEDKENVQNKKNKFPLIKINKAGNKSLTKNLSLNVSNLGERGTLRNLSNIKPDVSARRLSVSINKSVTTPLKRMSISSYTKENLHHPVKSQIKKAALQVESQYSLKVLPHALKLQNTKELTSSAKKLRPTAKIDSGCSSSSLDVKQQNVFVTPSKRYSISTPLKSASAMKPPLTPALNNTHKFVFPRFTPQPAKPSRLSFSRSWQPTGNSQYIATKELKQKNSITVPSSLPKFSSGIRNSPKVGKVSFSQSMSSASIRTSGKNVNKERFSCKARSPLFMEQDKKVARALFTNITGK